MIFITICVFIAASLIIHAIFTNAPYDNTWSEDWTHKVAIVSQIVLVLSVAAFVLYFVVLAQQHYNLP